MLNLKIFKNNFKDIWIIIIKFLKININEKIISLLIKNKKIYKLLNIIIIEKEFVC